jgi:alanine-glyoxylate transaminase/serine-glyoxylate transaminase/serine-pyruvate transaminase
MCSGVTSCWPRRRDRPSAFGRKARPSAFNIVEPNERCNTVTLALTHGHSPDDALRAYCDEKCGVVLGHGIGELSGKAFRIAHMGHVNAPMILGTLSVIEMALAALDIPYGRGRTQAAIDWLSEKVRHRRATERPWLG